MALEIWLVFLLAAVGLSFTPGPNGLLALTHGALHGVRRASATVFGGAVGFVVVIAIAMFGIGALIAAVPEVLTILKWVGGAYLVYLGVTVWRSPPIVAKPKAGAVTIEADEAADADALAAPGSSVTSAPATVSRWKLARQGFLAAVTNPKGILFFVAFLPQFINPNGDLFLQFVIMAATFVGIEIVFELVVAAFAQSLQGVLAKAGRWFNRVTGGLFIVVGVLLPWQL